MNVKENDMETEAYRQRDERHELTLFVWRERKGRQGVAVTATRQPECASPDRDSEVYVNDRPSCTFCCYMQLPISGEHWAMINTAEFQAPSLNISNSHFREIVLDFVFKETLGYMERQSDSTMLSVTRRVLRLQHYVGRLALQSV